ncbi:MAG: hypothetical protein JXR72_08135, partial [Proteobacteria bacterium]|nr:hypothetical protein [Pseudomonadota bacterium]
PPDLTLWHRLCSEGGQETSNQQDFRKKWKEREVKNMGKISKMIAVWGQVLREVRDQSFRAEQYRYVK